MGRRTLRPGATLSAAALTVPSGVTLDGSWTAPHQALSDKGTVLLAYAGRGEEDGPAFIEMQPNSAITGLTILYPEQKLADVQPYPWTIHGRGLHCSVANVSLANSYQGIAMGPEGNELHLVRNVYGCVLRRGIFIDNCTDIGRLENVHFNPHYWSRSGLDGVSKGAKPSPDIAVAIYTQQHLEAFVFGRSDWQSVRDCFVFGAKVGYRFVHTPNGECNGQLAGISADACQYGVMVDAAQSAGLLISNGQFACTKLHKAAQPRYGIVTSKSFHSTLQLSNCSFWGSFTSFARIQGDGMFSIAQARMENNEGPGIEVDGGRASIRDVYFVKSSSAPQIYAGPHLLHMGVSNCFAEGGIRIKGDNVAKVLTSNNEQP